MEYLVNDTGDRYPSDPERLATIMTVFITALVSAMSAYLVCQIKQMDLIMKYATNLWNPDLISNGRLNINHAYTKFIKTVG